MITLLQMSDIHFHSINPDEDYFSLMRNGVLQDMDFIKTNFSPVQSLLICGDIAFSGIKKEYDIARNFISDILKRLANGKNTPSVFVVPGNHDKNRNIYSATRQILNKALLNDNRKTADSFVSKLRSDEPDTLKILYSPFSEYNKFAFEYSSIEELSESIIREEPIADKAMCIKRNIGNLDGFNVWLVGMNSALCCDKNDSVDEEGEHHLQLVPLLVYNQNPSEKDIFISLIHHPIEKFVKHDKSIRSEFDKRFKVQLYGHIHRQSSCYDGTVKIFSGSLQPDDTIKNEYFPVYNVITLDIKNSNLIVCIKSRKWDGARFVNYDEECKSYSINLKHENTWDNEWDKGIKDSIENLSDNEKYTLRLSFINASSRKRNEIMSDLKYHYNKDDKNLLIWSNFFKFLDEQKLWFKFKSKLK